MVVAYCIGTDGAEHVEKSVTVSILDVVSETVLKVDGEVRLEAAPERAKFFFELDSLGRGEPSLNQWLGRFVREGTSTGRES